MSVELAEVAAGLPVAVSFALAGGLSSVREGRRRSSLNEAVHELRRPLQTLSLALPGGAPASTAIDSSLRLAAAALDRLDREINGVGIEESHTTFPMRPLLEETVRRWKTQAALAGGELRFVWRAGEVCLCGAPNELSQAVDNLISNAIEHGGARVTLATLRMGTWLLLSVHDEGMEADLRRSGSRRRRGRRGHGLRVVARTAHSHGGSFSLRRRGRGVEATLRLPLPLWEEGR